MTDSPEEVAARERGGTHRVADDDAAERDHRSDLQVGQLEGEGEQEGQARTATDAGDRRASAVPELAQPPRRRDRRRAQHER